MSKRLKYKIVVNELREATDVEKDPARDGNESFGGPFKPLQDRIEIMQGMKKDEARTTYMYISRLEEAENADGSAVKPGETVDPKAPRVAYVLASTLNNECLPKGSLIRGSRSGAKCEVLSTEWELLTDPLENPVIKWIKSFGMNVPIKLHCLELRVGQEESMSHRQRAPNSMFVCGICRLIFSPTYIRYHQRRYKGRRRCHRHGRGCERGLAHQKPSHS